MKFLTLPPTKKREREREEQKHNPTTKNIIPKTPEKLSLVTNYHKSLLPLAVKP